MSKLVEKAKIAAMSASLTKAWEYLGKNPEENVPKIMDLIDRVAPSGWYESQRNAFRKAIAEKSNWYDLIMKVWNLDEGVRNTFFKNFIVNASLIGSAKQEEVAEKENCNVPWAILLDPTSACNMHCTGCWAAEYGNRLNLSFEELDSIVSQGKELGTYMYIFTGGEEFCQEMLRVKNFVPAISLEGFEEANDGRRGVGGFEKVMHAMKLLKENKLPFGISACYTSKNCYDITSEEFFDMIMDAGALFIWFFHYMPVGNGAAPELLPTPEQRKMIYERIRAYRSSKAIFSMDFQNDAEYVGGCIAGGRRYLHINASSSVHSRIFALE